MKGVINPNRKGTITEKATVLAEFYANRDGCPWYVFRRKGLKGANKLQMSADHPGRGSYALFRIIYPTLTRPKKEALK